MRFEEAIGQWEDGARRLSSADPELHPMLERARDAVVAELRRRLGGGFTAAELAELYPGDADWIYELAVLSAPGVPEAWDVLVVGGAAFLRYLREASDYGGGRLVAGRD